MKQSAGDRMFGIGVYIIIGMITLIVLYPLVYVLSASFSDPGAVLRGDLWLFPIDPTLESYTRVFQNEDIWTGFRNTFLYTTLGTALNLGLSIMIAYPLSRKNFYGRNLLTIFLVFTMFFSGGMVPTYLLVRDLGMLNTIWAVIVPGAVSVYNVIIIRTFFQNIPNELRESADLDAAQISST